MSWLRNQPESPPKTGLILAGGGARAAYQVGVLKAIARMRAHDSSNPFPILCGTSAGAINATALAIYGANFHEAVARLVNVWTRFKIEQVIRADALGILKGSSHWFAAMLLGGLGRYNPSSLFDRRPLEQLLGRYLPCEKIQESIDQGVIEALSITASGYTSGQSVTFYQGAQKIKPWKRAVRVGCPTDITLVHLMASSAIPFVFEAVKVNREYFGDGSMRQIAPISPALHLGAERILVIGVHAETDSTPKRVKNPDYPSMAQVAGNVLNSIFLDSLDVDLERLHRINRTLESVPKKQFTNGSVELRSIETLVISPSRDIGEIAARHAHRLPWTMRFLLKGIGGLNRSGTDLLSYLLFEQAYCRELIALGYSDTIKRRDEISTFLQ